MKKKFLIFCLAAAMLMQLSTSCTKKVFITQKAPPGQVKKATGSQSAKPYAPGQQKKKK
jgi:hypothetical protein